MSIAYYRPTVVGRFVHDVMSVFLLFRPAVDQNTHRRAYEGNNYSAALRAHRLGGYYSDNALSSVIDRGYSTRIIIRNLVRQLFRNLARVRRIIICLYMMTLQHGLCPTSLRFDRQKLTISIVCDVIVKYCFLSCCLCCLWRCWPYTTDQSYL